MQPGMQSYQQSFEKFCIRNTAVFFSRFPEKDKISSIVKPVFQKLSNLSDEEFEKTMEKELKTLSPKEKDLTDPEKNNQNPDKPKPTCNSEKEEKFDDKKDPLSEKEREDLERYIQGKHGKSLDEIMKEEKKRKKEEKKKKKPVQTINSEKKPHPTLKPGDACECCGKGKLYETDPKQETIVHFIPGRIVQVKNFFQNLRCNACQTYAYTPPSNTPGVVEKKSAELSAHVIVNIANGIPANRLQTIFRCQGMHLSRQIIDRIIYVRGKELEPIIDALKKRLANCPLIGTDATSFKVLEVTQKKEDPNYRKGTSKKPEDRCSSRASVVFALNEERVLQGVVYSFSQLHCGEFLEKILEKRNVKDPFTLMGDLHPTSDTSNYNAVDSKIKKSLKKNKSPSQEDLDDLPYTRAACNDHLIVYFKKAAENYPRLQRIIHLLRQVYSVDKTCKDFSLNSQERLDVHQNQSIARFEKMKILAEEFMNGSEKEIKAEPNSQEGLALKYFLKNYDHFIQFLKIPGIPLSNILSETALKWIILIRKNSWFLRTIDSAKSWAYLISLCYTAHHLGLNAEAYLTILFKNKDKWIKNPEEWEPMGFLRRYEKTGSLPPELANPLYKKPVLDSLYISSA